MNNNPESRPIGVDIQGPEEITLPDRIRERELTSLVVVRTNGIIVRLAPIRLGFDAKH